MIESLLAAADPINATLTLVVWWRLDKRLRDLRMQVPEDG